MSEEVVAEVKARRRQMPQSVKDGYARVKELYDRAIEQLSEERDRLDEFEDLYGLSESQQKLVRAIQGDHLEGQGGLVEGVKKEMEQPTKAEPTEEREFTPKILEKFEKEWFTQFADFKTKGREFYEKEKFVLYKGYIIDSLIVEDPKRIFDFFKDKHIAFTLVYRASEHAFSAPKFHTICDGMTHTLTLVSTEHGKIVGGYTELAWGSSDSDKYITDEEGNSFIFSYTLNEKYPLTQKTHAICHNSTWGPTFGRAHDIGICNEANTRPSSYFDFPTSYNSGIYERNQ